MTDAAIYTFGTYTSKGRKLMGSHNKPCFNKYCELLEKKDWNKIKIEKQCQKILKKKNKSIGEQSNARKNGNSKINNPREGWKTMITNPKTKRRDNIDTFLNTLEI